MVYIVKIKFWIVMNMEVSGSLMESTCLDILSDQIEAITNFACFPDLKKKILHATQKDWNYNIEFVHFMKVSCGADRWLSSPENILYLVFKSETSGKREKTEDKISVQKEKYYEMEMTKKIKTTIIQKWGGN